jgi:hypothetical protein
MNINDMPAGRKMDEMVARVIGYRVVRASGIDILYTRRVVKPFVAWINWMNSLVRFRGKDEIISKWEPWSPSTDMRAAWEVVEKLTEEGFVFDLHIGPSASVTSFWGKGGHVSQDLDHGPLANRPLSICRAALKASHS